MRRPLTLPDNPSAVQITDLRRPIVPPSMETSLDNWQNRNSTVTTRVQLVAGQTLRLLPKNPRRSGLQIQNLDVAANLSYSFGNDLGAQGLVLTPNAMALYDFTTPADELYLFAAVNLTCIVMEMTRIMQAPVSKRKA